MEFVKREFENGQCTFVFELRLDSYVAEELGLGYDPKISKDILGEEAYNVIRQTVLESYPKKV